MIIDPPSLAKRQSEKVPALEAYDRLTASGLKLLRPGGILVAASCSAHVRADEFFGLVRAVARRSRLAVTELETARHAPDHPARIPEADYLKAIYLQRRSASI